MAKISQEKLNQARGLLNTVFGPHAYYVGKLQIASWEQLTALYKDLDKILKPS